MCPACPRSWLWGQLALGSPPAPHTTRCLSHYQRTAWRGPASSAPRSADPYIVGPLYPPSMDNVGFEGTSLMLLWGLSPQPLSGVPYSSHIPSCLRLGYLPCPTATLLQALLSPGSSSPLPQPSLPFPSLSWKLAILSIFPLFFLPARLQMPPPCPEGSVPYLWGRIRGEPAAIAPSPHQPPSFACGTAPVGCHGVPWGAMGSRGAMPRQLVPSWPRGRLPRPCTAAAKPHPSSAEVFGTVRVSCRQWSDGSRARGAPRALQSPITGLGFASKLT